MKLPIFAVFLVFLGVACQSPPTRVKEHLTIGPSVDYTRTITDLTVILDARPLFLFSSGHIPNAQPVRWDFFGQSHNPALLRTDLNSIARELARLGVAPNKHVLVVGLGRGAMGEEGRVAWMLNYLGVKNVVFAREGFFTVKRKAGEASPNQNAPEWIPQVDATLIAEKKELEKAMKGANRDFQVIDVRNVDEYLGKSPEVPIRPDIGAVNVPWTEFIDEEGLPNKALAAQLNGIGIGRDKRVVLISEEGVRSALATQVLRELGYKKAGNFAGGFKELFPERETKAAGKPRSDGRSAPKGKKK